MPTHQSCCCSPQDFLPLYTDIHIHPSNILHRHNAVIVVSTRKRSATISVEGIDGAKLFSGDDIEVLTGDSDVISEVESAYNTSSESDSEGHHPP